MENLNNYGTLLLIALPKYYITNISRGEEELHEYLKVVSFRLI